MSTITTTPAKRGRPTAVYTDRNGNHILGLMKLQDGRWRATGPDKWTFTEPDEARAIAHFREWQEKKAAKGHAIVVASGLNRDGLGVADVSAAIAKAAKKVKVRVRIPRDPSKGITVEKIIDLDDIWTYVRDEIIARPKWVAERTGIEQLGYLIDLKKPEVSPTLAEIATPYIIRTDISAKEVQKAKTNWDEFADFVGVKTLREITPEAIANYGRKVAALKLSAKSVYHRYNKCKTVLNYYRTTGKHLEDVRKALDCFAVLQTPECTNVDPHPISRANWDTLYTAVKDQHEAKAMLLVCLNFAFYPIDLARLQWSEMDMERGTFSAKRGKTKVARVAVIWPETLEALKQLKRSEEDDYVFHTVTGRPHNDNTIRKWFYDLRDTLKMPTTVQMADIRDGAYTEAVQGEGVEFVHAQILAGHRAAGMADMYVRRNPRMVAKACEAVRQAYILAPAAK